MNLQRSRMLRITINILHYNTFEITSRCIDSCLNQVGIEYRILLIDNNSTDDSLSRLKEKYGDKIDYLHNQNNYGFARGNNIGVKYCYGKGINYSLLLNSDVELQTSCVLKKVFDVIEQYPKCAISVPEVYNITGKGPRLRENDSKYLRFLSYFGILPKRKKISENVYRVNIAHGSTLLVNNKLFTSLGGFPEHYFMYGEESSFEKQVQWAGYDILWLRDSKNCVYHYHDTDVKQDEWRDFLDGRNQAIEYMENKKKFPLRWCIAFHLCLLIQICKHNSVFVKGCKHGLSLFKKNLSTNEIYQDGVNIRNRGIV